jgi:hypothetical protein
MKKLSILIAALFAFGVMAAMAQDTGGQASSSGTSASGQASTDQGTQSTDQSTTTTTKKTHRHHRGMGAKATGAKWVSGKISDDGKTLTGDKDNTTYTIANPDAVKGHEGHDVRVKGTLDASNNLTVSTVKMKSMKAGKKSKKASSGSSPS